MHTAARQEFSTTRQRRKNNKQLIYLNVCILIAIETILIVIAWLSNKMFFQKKELGDEK